MGRGGWEEGVGTPFSIKPMSMCVLLRVLWTLFSEQGHFSNSALLVGDIEQAWDKLD